MKQRNLMRIGNLVTLPTLTARDVWPQGSNGDLTEILGSYNLADLIISLAQINLFLHRSDHILECDRFLKSKFCSRYLRHKIERHKFDEHNVFNRESTLRLLSESVKIANHRAPRARDNVADPGKKLGDCYLVANGLSKAESTESRSELAEEQRKELLAGLMPSWEYAIYTSPWHLIKKSLVRTEEYLECLEQVSSMFNANEIFRHATGLTIRDYQYLIFSMLSVVLKFSPEEILEGSALYIDMNPSPSLAPLYDKLLQHTCVSIDELTHGLEAEEKCSIPNEFRFWRKFPLVKSRDNKVFPIDISFLRDKLDTGVFWIIRDQLEEGKEGKGADIIGLWGEVFEDYAASMVQRGIEARRQSRIETCIIKPKYDRREEAECTDIAVHGSETLILLECKAPVLTAQTKFSNNFSDFRHGIRRNVMKGIKQLSNAIQRLGHANESERWDVQGIDMSTIKTIYPVLVLSDRTFSLLFMNRVFNLEFQRLKQCFLLRRNLEVMPLTVLTIDELEILEPYLRDTPFYAHLDKWLQVRDSNESYPFTEYLHSLMDKELRENTYIDQKWERIFSEIKAYFSAHGLE